MVLTRRNRARFMATSCNGPAVIRVGPSGSTQTSRSTLEAVQHVSDLGLSALEVNYVRGARASEGTTRRIGQLAADLDIALSAHAPYYVSMNSKRPEVRENSVEYVVETARRCMWLGAPFFAVHAGSYRRSRQGTDELPLTAGSAARTARQLHAVGGVEDDRIAKTSHYGQPPHIHHEVAVTEAGASLGDENARTTRPSHFLHGVLHVPRGHELSFFQVDNSTGFRHGDK